MCFDFENRDIQSGDYLSLLINEDSSLEARICTYRDAVFHLSCTSAVVPCVYLTGLTVELCLKCLLDNVGRKYNKIHNLNELYELVKLSGFSDIEAYVDYIKDLAKIYENGVSLRYVHDNAGRSIALTHASVNMRELYEILVDIVDVTVRRKTGYNFIPLEYDVVLGIQWYDIASRYENITLAEYLGLLLLSDVSCYSLSLDELLSKIDKQSFKRYFNLSSEHKRVRRNDRFKVSGLYLRDILEFYYELDGFIGFTQLTRKEERFLHHIDVLYPELIGWAREAVVDN